MAKWGIICHPKTVEKILEGISYSDIQNEFKPVGGLGLIKNEKVTPPLIEFYNGEEDYTLYTVDEFVEAVKVDLWLLNRPKK